ncbi:DUF732 domain-containing protein [Mycobacterium sp. NAZ190054]|uniref:DUF732 domain-containing protein n=1 Tax=Mycobacterium sp. NAZ190054 TaxID=1747766 RepID=UPI0007914FB6|nr:DUF732 domain-containing protein [Mycobacterium sp. NAZ190054]KWX60696.1 hypothetical protein ASJ79_09100 [Mycobacterium sp. NAZ190054]
MVRRSMGAAAVVLAAAVMSAAAAAPAAAWPIPLTADQVNYLNSVRGNFPGNDDQLLLAGKQACRLLYTGQPAQAVIDTIAGQYGATRDQAAGLTSAARGTMCTQAPG